MAIVIDGQGSVTVGGTATINSSGFKIGNSTVNSSIMAISNTEIPFYPEALAMQNMYVNGEMRVSQLNGNTQGNVVSYFAADLHYSGWDMATLVCNTYQSSDAPPGYNNSFYLNVVTANTTPNTTNYFLTTTTAVEGTRISRLAWGTANAQPATLGMWIKTSLTGTYSVAVQNNPCDHTWMGLINVTKANTWNWYTWNIPAQTSGTWPSNTSIGVTINICTGCGSAVTVGSGWTSSATIYRGITGQTNLGATVGATWQVTGIVFLVGSYTISANQAQLIQRHYDKELEICQRYWQKTFTVMYTQLGGIGSYGGAVVQQQIAPTMRTTPTGTYISTGNSGSYGSVTFSLTSNNWYVSAVTNQTTNGAYNNVTLYMSARPQG